MKKRYKGIIIITFICSILTSFFWMGQRKNTLQQSEAVSSQSIFNKKKAFSVYAGGEQIGIYIKTKGVLVLEIQGVETKKGIFYPAKGKLRVGDYILKINGEIIYTKSQFIHLLQENGAKKCQLTIKRKNRQMTVVVAPVKEQKENIWQIGVWLRNNTQGIGTLTYVMPGGTYGALGHSITDYELGCNMPLEQGSIYRTSIYSIQKGTKGTPGELIGNIQYDKEEYLGTIEYNTPYGISGKIVNQLANYQKGPLIEVARKKEIREGEAWVRSCVSGKCVDYKIYLRRNKKTMAGKQKSLMIEITDQRLLKLTGGIVQGLSGSPIIQDGKLVGAVTHVLVEDSKKGYGIMIEDMIK